MPTSQNKIQQTEAYLLQQINAADAALFEARLILQPDLQQDIIWQQRVYNVVKLYGRRKLKADIEAAHRQLFTAPQHKTFRQKIFSLFNRQ